MDPRIKSQVISGKLAAEALLAEVNAETSELVKLGVQPGLAVVIVGSDPASQVYISSKRRKAEECGLFSVKHELAHDTAEEELLDVIASLN